MRFPRAISYCLLKTWKLSTRILFQDLMVMLSTFFSLIVYFSLFFRLCLSPISVPFPFYYALFCLSRFSLFNYSHFRLLLFVSFHTFSFSFFCLNFSFCLCNRSLCLYLSPLSCSLHATPTSL